MPADVTSKAFKLEGHFHDLVRFFTGLDKLTQQGFFFQGT